MAEDFMQYQLQQQGAPRRRRQQPQGPTTPAQTPFMPNGQPMPAPQAAPQQPQQPQQPAPAPPQESPYGPGWVPYGNGGWAPPGSPAAVQAQQQQAAAAPPAPVDPRLGQRGSVDARGVYTAGQAPTQTYQAQHVKDFRAPDLSSVQAPTQKLIEQLLANPQTMTPQVIDQLKGREQDAASLMERQIRDSIMGDAARRGLGVDSNYVQGQIRGLADSTNRGLLGSYRDIDINAIGQNRADMMNAIGTGNDYQNQALQRAISAFNPSLAVGQERRAEGTTELDSILQRFGAQEGLLGNQAQTIQAALGRDMQGGIAAADRQQRESEFGRQFGFNVDQFNYQKQQAEADRIAQQQAASAANDRWAESQAMSYINNQEDDWNNLLGMLLGGGGGF